MKTNRTLFPVQTNHVLGGFGDKDAMTSVKSSFLRVLAISAMSFAIVVVFAEKPDQSPTALVQTDALARIRAEQERIVQELEAAKGDTQSIKGHRQR